jgi:GntR family transcriptional regulator
VDLPGKVTDCDFCLNTYNTKQMTEGVAMETIRIDPSSPAAPYEQLRTQVAAMTVTGELAAGQKLPTVRQLAADLGLAPNTVARAYRELEADGVISTQGRRGTFVSSAALDSPDDSAVAVARAAAVSFTEAARRSGLSLAEATRLVEASWPRTTS